RFLHQSIARGLDRLAEKPGGASLARFARRVWNVSVATYSAAYDAVLAYGKELGKGHEEAARVAGLLATADVVLAKPAVLAAELAGVPGLSFAVGMIPIASTAYLAVSAFRNPRAVLRAAHAGLIGFLDRVKDPDRYKATAVGEAEGDRIDRKAVSALW